MARRAVPRMPSLGSGCPRGPETGEDFLYVFKGALSAPGPGLATALGQRRARRPRGPSRWPGATTINASARTARTGHPLVLQCEAGQDHRPGLAPIGRTARPEYAVPRGTSAVVRSTSAKKFRLSGLVQGVLDEASSCKVTCMQVKIVFCAEPGTEESDEIDDLAAALKAEGRSVALQNNWGSLQPPAGLSTFEEILIFIGSGASTALLNAIVTDVYNAAKNWGRKRFGNQSRMVNAPTIRFSIKGPDDERLVVWWIDGEGENELDYRRDFDVILDAVGSSRIQVMKELRTSFEVDIERAKQAVENTPTVLIERTEEKTAEKIRTVLEDAGAVVTVRRHVPDWQRSKLETGPLTEHEEALLIAFANGKSIAEIADTLNTSWLNIMGTLPELMDRLGGRTREDAIELAKQMGLI
jgi:ribosomal protein L7/L12/DNA-binding CsgD family transcriptional regulator